MRHTSTLGERTEGARHGFFSSSSSSTAAANTDETFAKITRRYVGARTSRVRSHVWIVDGFTCRSCLSPSVGIACTRRRSSTASRVDVSNVCTSSHCSAKFLKVIFPAPGSMYVPRSLSASTVAANFVASPFLMKVFFRSRPSGSRYRTSNRRPAPVWRS